MHILSCEQKFTENLQKPDCFTFIHVHHGLQKQAQTISCYLGTIICYKCKGTQAQRSIKVLLYHLGKPFIAITTILS